MRWSLGRVLRSVSALPLSDRRSSRANVGARTPPSKRRRAGPCRLWMAATPFLAARPATYIHSLPVSHARASFSTDAADTVSLYQVNNNKRYFRHKIIYFLLLLAALVLRAAGVRSRLCGRCGCLCSHPFSFPVLSLPLSLSLSFFFLFFFFFGVSFSHPLSIYLYIYFFFRVPLSLPHPT